MIVVVNRCKRCRYVRYPGFIKKGRRTVVWLAMGAFKDETPASIKGNHICDDCKKEIEEERVSRPKPKPWELPKAVKLEKPWIREGKTDFVNLLR